MAVWIRDRVVYDAYKAATRLRLPQDKLPIYFRHECIVIGISDDDYSTLAWFHRVTERKSERVFFDRMFSRSTLLPVGPLQVLPETRDDIDEIKYADRESQRWKNDGSAALSDEVYCRTGDYRKVSALAGLLLYQT